MSDWIIFDYDGTLATHRSGWTVLHSVFGTEHVQTDRLEAYRTGDLSFEDWADLDVENWIQRGATKSDINRVAEAIKLSTGIEPLIAGLADRNYSFGVLSGGLTDLTKKIQSFDPDFICANPLVYDEFGSLVGVEKRVGPSHKGEMLETLGTEHGFDHQDVVFVGDSHSDIEAFEVAKRSILFDPDPALAEDEHDVADTIIPEHDLELILEYL
jgi:phosphoserine phosphatase